MMDGVQKAIRAISLVFCALALISVAHANPEQSERTLEALEDHIISVAQSGDNVGLAVAVVRGGEIVFVSTHGRRSLSGAEPIDKNTRFRIASLSKAFAATVVARLVAEEKLSLTDKASDFAPALRLKSDRQLSALTLENVLSHRAGLPPYAYDNLLEAGVDPDEILRRFGNVDLICPVGQCYGYQNVIYNIAASAIEASKNQAYDDIIRTQLLEPLDMSNASLGWAGLIENDNWARPHRRRRGGPWQVIDVKDPYYKIPAAGGVNATILDMATWLSAQMGGAPDVITPQMRALLFAPRVETPGEIRRNRQMTDLRKAHYALGWRVFDYAGATVINHSGSVDGYAAQIAFLPERDVGIVLLTNSRDKVFWSILPTFLNLELALGGGAIDPFGK